MAHHVRHADETKQCEELDEKAAALTKSLDEKRRRLRELEDVARKQEKYRDLLGSNDVSDLVDGYESSKRSGERKEGKLASLEAEIETQRLGLDRLRARGDDGSGAGDPRASPNDGTADK